MRRVIDRLKGVSLAFKLSILVLGSVSVIFLGAFEYNYRVSRQIILDKVKENARDLTQSTVERVSAVLAPIEAVGNYVTKDIQHRPLQTDDLKTLTAHAVEANSAIFGSAIAFEPRSFPAETAYVECYSFRDSGRISVNLYGDDSRDDHLQDWYLLPKYLGHTTWSEPYFDVGGGNIVMTTFSSPFYREQDGKRVFWGVNTVDVSLEWLQKYVGDISLYRTGYAFIISGNGVFVTHPNSHYIMKESIFSLAEHQGNAEARLIGKDMIRGGSGFVPVSNFQESTPSWLYYAPIGSTGWSLGMLVPEKELFADIAALRQRVLTVVALCLGLLLLIIIAVSMRVTKPLRMLSSVTAEIARGNLDIALPPVSSGDEVGKLSRSFEDMRVALKEYIADLTRTTAAKERIESELKIARHIQMSFLPRHFPSFSDQSAFDLHALLEPAKEVGGDLYDFFLLDDDHLFLSVGDVSGKGVPAALLMAVTKTLIKGVAEQGVELDEVLRRVNLELCQDNDSMMFVTLFCAVIDLRSGEMRYASAGHNPCLIVPANGAPRWLEQPLGVVLGVAPEAVFEAKTVHLSRGDALVAYTDGVTEAMNVEQGFFGEGRLLECAANNAKLSAQDMTARLLAAVREFAGEAEQSDDITALVVKYAG